MPDSLPPDEVSETQSREVLIRRLIPRQWIALGAIVIVHMALGGVFGFFSESGDMLLDYFSAGIVLSQPILIAIWMVLAPYRFHIRFLWGLFLFTVMFFAVGCGISLNGPSGAEVYATINLIILVVAYIMLSLVRRLTRWQIIHCDGKQAASDYQVFQFGIKHLIILTAIVALALGLCRTLLLVSPQKSLPGISLIAKSVCEFTVMLFPIIIIPWFTLAYVRNAGALIMRAVFLIGIVDVVAYCIFKWITWNPYDIARSFLFFQCGASMSMFATAIVIRLCGFRMARVPASNTQIYAQ